MDKWFKDPYHNRGRDQMRKKGIRNSSACASSLKLFDKTSSRHLCVGMYWFWYFLSRHWLCYFELNGYSFYFHFQIHCFLLLLWFLMTECDKGNFGEDCKSGCHCFNGVGCNNVNGQCPNGHCDAGWKPGTCSQGKEFLI